MFSMYFSCLADIQIPLIFPQGSLESETARVSCELVIAVEKNEVGGLSVCGFRVSCDMTRLRWSMAQRVSYGTLLES